SEGCSTASPQLLPWVGSQGPFEIWFVHHGPTTPQTAGDSRHSSAARGRNILPRSRDRHSDICSRTTPQNPGPTHGVSKARFRQHGLNQSPRRTLVLARFAQFLPCQTPDPWRSSLLPTKSKRWSHLPV